jgi:hypothetical protein
VLYDRLAKGDNFSHHQGALKTKSTKAVQIKPVDK